MIVQYTGPVLRNHWTAKWHLCILEKKCLLFCASLDNFFFLPCFQVYCSKETCRSTLHVHGAVTVSEYNYNYIGAHHAEAFC